MLKMALFDCAINEKCCSVDGGRGICPLFSSPLREFDSSRVPTPGNLPSHAKKGISPGEGWVQVELTDALYFEHYAKVPIIIFQTWATCART